MDTTPTKVLFRQWGSTVIALFPEVPDDIYGHFCSSYQQVGQHGGANPTMVIAHSRAAKPAEYKSLKEELESLGYVLDIKARYTNAMRENRYAAHWNWFKKA
jgi:cobalamin biosynthesis Mg chelatase CobN